MRPSLTLRLAALGGWPRRLAALACLLLAAATALRPQPANPGAAPTAQRPTDGLGAGEVAVPVPLADATACTLLRPGDRVDLYPANEQFASRETPQPAGSGLRVLALARCSARGSLGTEEHGATVVVAAGRAEAGSLARFLPSPMVAVSLSRH